MVTTRAAGEAGRQAGRLHAGAPLATGQQAACLLGGVTDGWHDTGWLAVWHKGSRLADCLADCLADWLADCLADWLSLTCRDEPTSGLDSAAAYYVMAAVNRLAERCRTIIRQAGQEKAGWQHKPSRGACEGAWEHEEGAAQLPRLPFTTNPAPPHALIRPLPPTRSVIHQPSSEVFALFDKLCLLSDGHVVYFGAASRAADFFAQAGLGVPANRNPGALRCRVARGGALGPEE